MSPTSVARSGSTDAAGLAARRRPASRGMVRRARVTSSASRCARPRRRAPRPFASVSTRLGFAPRRGRLHQTGRATVASGLATDGHPRAIALSDPGGNRLELCSPLAQAPPAPRRFDARERCCTPSHGCWPELQRRRDRRATRSRARTRPTGGARPRPAHLTQGEIREHESDPHPLPPRSSAPARSAWPPPRTWSPAASSPWCSRPAQRRRERARVGPRPRLLPLGVQRGPGRRRAAGGRRLGAPGGRRLPDRRRAGRALPGAAGSVAGDRRRAAPRRARGRRGPARRSTSSRTPAARTRRSSWWSSRTASSGACWPGR